MLRSACGRLAGTAPQQVPGVAVRVRAGHAEVPACAEVAVPNPGGDHHHVPGGQHRLDASPALAAQPHVRVAREDAQHLVARGMVMVERINAVPPTPPPVPPGENLLADRRRIVARQTQHAAVDQQRQLGVVRDRAVVLQHMLLHRGRGVETVAERNVGGHGRRFHIIRIASRPRENLVSMLQFDPARPLKKSAREPRTKSTKFTKEEKARCLSSFGTKRG